MDAVFEYLTGQRREGHPALLESFAAASRAAAATQRCDLDLPYGPHPRQRFDFFPARDAGPATPILCYFHAGYWQSRDKADFRFIAPAFAATFSVALVNYPLCPEVTLDALVAAAEPATAAVRAHAGAGAATTIVAGHSAGGHIAVELALRRPSAMAGAIGGVVALSGVYELAPLLDTPLNDNLRLDAAAAARNSPVGRVTAGVPPALFAVGGGETPEFIRQSRQMAQAWQASGALSTAMVVGADDHFTLLTTLCEPESDLHRAVCGLAG